jgi:cytoskeletal protein RodZ
MKEIGEKLRDARLSMGISIEEASEDLKIRPSQLELIEDGNSEAFKDVFYLKYFIRDYAKYLGLNYEEVIDDYNEYLFDYTSKISLEDIKNESLKNKPKEKIVSSPYTKQSNEIKVVPILTIILGILILIILIVGIYLFIANKNSNEGSISLNERKVLYELT